MQQTFEQRLQDKIQQRLLEWQRTQNWRARRALKREIWTLTSVLRDYRDSQPAMVMPVPKTAGLRMVN